MLEFVVVGIALLAICGLFAFALHIDPVSGRWLGRAGIVNYLVRLTGVVRRSVTYEGHSLASGDTCGVVEGELVSFPETHPSVIS
jgi:hypothetical protein